CCWPPFSGEPEATAVTTAVASGSPLNDRTWRRNLPMRIHARHYRTRTAVEIVCEHGRIQSLGVPSSSPPHVQAGWVAPALFDPQINGCDGHGFTSERLTLDTVRHVVATCRRHGIGTLCPTLVTNAFAALAHGLKTLRQACESDTDLAGAIAAIHLEG